MTPRQGNTFLFRSSQQLNCLGPLKGFLSCHGAFQGPSTLPRVVPPELRRGTGHRQVYSTKRGGLGHRLNRLTQTLILLVKNTLLRRSLILKSKTKKLSQWPQLALSRQKRTRSKKKSYSLVFTDIISRPCQIAHVWLYLLQLADKVG